MADDFDLNEWEDPEPGIASSSPYQAQEKRVIGAPETLQRRKRNASPK